MAFRIFRILVGLVFGGLAVWLLATAALDVRDAGDSSGWAVYVMPGLKVLGALVMASIFYYALCTESRMRQVLENIFSIPELLKKLAFTLVLLCIYRIGYHVPLPGIDPVLIGAAAKSSEEGGSGFGDALAAFGMLTGGNLQQSTLFGLGIMPYISASIIFQLLATVLPSLQKLQKEGPAGYKKIQEYTRYATVVICLVQAAAWMSHSRVYMYADYSTSMWPFIMGIVGLTAGTVFMMWLGEQIDEYGIGNGISLIIMAGIVARLPWAVEQVTGSFSFDLTATGMNPVKLLILVLGFVFVVAGAILITQGQRRIPIQQAKHTRGRRVYGGQRQYLPLRVNHGGVMPIIFASSLMMLPMLIGGWAQSRWGDSELVLSLSNAFRPDAFVYTVVEVALIFFFAYFWTTVQFRPKEMAEQLRDYGSFIPGLRPGKRTADYLERVMERITYCGAAFLAVIAVIPQVVQTNMGVPYNVAQFLGGTGLLISVSVALDLVQRIESNLVMRNYGGFLGGSTRIKGAYS